MNIPQPAPDATPEQDDAYYRAILQDLIGRGADLARRIHESATVAASTTGNSPDIAAAPDPTIAFDRITRAVRRTIALARHIAAGTATARQPTTRANTNARTNARANLIRGVEDAIHRKRKDVDAEALEAELRERLDNPELEFDLENRPTEDIIEEICRDLGVAVQGRSWIWKRRTPKDIAALRARAAGAAATGAHASPPDALRNPPMPDRRTWPPIRHNAPS